ncbi:RNA 2',3'-cyclic phosphodiesterase [Candidatus Woesearchaeota archaeon]|nr:MAG: RNA 2',3'-cyclic phosphodiesterase [Candidatus Woesearchaeota archaeon]
MRLFIAIELPEEIKKLLEKAQNHLKNNSDRVSWVKKENMHLTLKFLGEISDENKVIKALKKVVFKPFEAETSDLGVFPSQNYIKVVWLGLKSSEQTKELHDKIDEQLFNIGIKKDKNFVPHMTLGRVKYIKDKKAFVQKISNFRPEEKPFKVQGFSLIKSELTPTGPIYSTINNFKAKSL